MFLSWRQNKHERKTGRQRHSETDFQEADEHDGWEGMIRWYESVYDFEKNVPEKTILQVSMNFRLQIPIYN